MTTRRQNTATLLLCGLLGAAVFLLVYGVAPLNFLDDTWMLAGYDGSDLLQHYAGWLGFRNSDWAFPLGYANALSIPDGTIISFTDSIPYVAILCKLFRGLLPTVFQYFGPYNFLCFVLQGVAAGMLLSRAAQSRALTLLGAGFFCTAPILLERSFRHVALASHWLPLFALWLYLEYRAEPQKKAFPWQFFLLNFLTVGLHPYFLPMTMLFTLLAVLELALRCHKPFRAALLFGGNALLALAAGWCIGALGWAVSPTRSGYGFFTLNLNALVNPVSVYGYDWSRLLPDLPQTAGQYDAFNYFGLGGLLLLLLALLLLLRRLRAKAPANWLDRNALLLAGCAFLSLFALSNVITLGDKSFTVPLPQTLLDLGGIFRSSGRLFWPVSYCILLWALYQVIRAWPRRRAALALALLLAVGLADGSGALLTKHRAMQENAAGKNASVLFADETLAALGETHDKLLWTNNVVQSRMDLAVFAGRQGMGINAVIANSGNFDAAWNSVMEGAEAQIESGALDRSAVYVSSGDYQWEAWQALYGSDPTVTLYKLENYAKDWDTGAEYPYEYFLIPLGG